MNVEEYEDDDENEEDEGDDVVIEEDTEKPVSKISSSTELEKVDIAEDMKREKAELKNIEKTLTEDESSSGIMLQSSYLLFLIGYNWFYY